MSTYRHFLGIKMTNFSTTYFAEAAKIAGQIDIEKVESLASALNDLRNRNGRLFFLGVGGSAANCAHAVNDFRKLCHIESYSPTDNVSELTARTNDEGWDSVFEEWLKGSRANENDAIFVLSVGGGNMEKNVSPNIVNAVKWAKENKLTVFGIVGREDGYTYKVGDHVIAIPQVSPDRITPHTEAFQAVVWHGLVSHPILQQQSTKW